MSARLWTTCQKNSAVRMCLDSGATIDQDPDTVIATTDHGWILRALKVGRDSWLVRLRSTPDHWWDLDLDPSQGELPL